MRTHRRSNGIKRLENFRNSPSENQIQIAFFEWAEKLAPRHKELDLLYHIANGAHKSPQARGLYKRLGLKAGVPDVHLPVRRGDHIGLWIEFKSEKGRVSEAQKRWIKDLEKEGHKILVLKSAEEAALETLKYLGLKDADKD